MSHRVLIVDDEAGIRQALKQVLEYEDLEVRVASSGGEAISLYCRVQAATGLPRRQDGGARRARNPLPSPQPGRCRADRHDLRPRDDRHRGRSHPARRLRFSGKAARYRPSPPHGAQCPRPRAARRRERQASRGHREPVSDGRLEPGPAASPAAHRQSRPHRRPRADHRRQRHRQGAGRARPPRSLAEDAARPSSR